MQPPQESVIAEKTELDAEKTELDDRHAKLNAFAKTETFDALPDVEKDRLARQSQAMDLYSVVLGERIEAFD